MLFLIKVLKNASAARLRSTARWVQAQCGRKMLTIYLDMVWCALRHEVHISYVLLKIGRGGAPCDNTGCGGMFCRVDASRGIVISDATDDSRNVYSEHPETHQAFFGLKIPRFAEALLLAVRCAALAPEVRHIGWDIAITPDGAELVEGNADPGVMCQFAPHTPEKRGLWPYYLLSRAFEGGRNKIARIKPAAGKFLRRFLHTAWTGA